MKRNLFTRIIISCLLILFSNFVASAQKTAANGDKAKSIIFAVLDNGTSIEPIAFLDKGELTEAVGGSSDEQALNDFAKSFYSGKKTYQLIFGGANAGTVSVKSYDTKTDCGKNIAQVTTQSAKAKLKGMVMALATNATVGKTAGVRRPPTADERAEIESLVRAAYTKEKIAASATKNLRSHNLTAIDVDNDGKAEMVGSYWVAPTATSRALLFFIADKNADGKYSFGYSEFRNVKQDEVMSGEIKALDTGIYNELFLDSFDYNGDGSGEIFTYSQAFEGVGFNVYRHADGKWTRVFEGSNYHCAF